MAAEVDADLIKILNSLSLSADTRCKGWKYVLGLTACEEGVNYIIQSNVYIPFLLSCIEEDKMEDLLIFSFKCLINICNHEQGVIAVLNCKKDLLEYLTHVICEGQSKFVQHICYTLSNISAHPGFDQQITEILFSSKALLKKLMDKYCSLNLDLRNKYDFLTLVFANVSRISSGRRLFIHDTEFMVRMSSFTKETEPEIRRLGVALILRNCCSELDHHERMLEELAILPVLLLPLMDSKEYKEDEMAKLPVECQCLEESKARETNASVRYVLVQALTALCYSKKGWDYLQIHGAYYVIRDLHLWETDEKVKDVIENLVSYLIIIEDYFHSDEDKQNDDEEDRLLIQQLEADIVRDLPDFVVK